MDKWLKLIDFFGILDKLVDSISEELKTSIHDGILKFKETADASPSKLDDIVVKILMIIFKVEEV